MADIHTGSDLSITKMVLNRLPFLKDTSNNRELVSNFILEVMYELETCFRINTSGDNTRVGNETYYNIPKKAIVADIVSCYILTIQVIANAGGVANTSDISATSNKFLSKTIAGSVEVEWEQLDPKKGSGIIGTVSDMLDSYKKSAIRKARAMGCIIDICSDCTTSVELAMNRYTLPTPIVVVEACDATKKDTPERG